MSDTKKKSALLLLPTLLVALLAVGQVYKWIDEQGQVHFGDRPPDQTDAQELTAPQGPSEAQSEAAEEQLQQTIELREQREQLRAEEKQQAAEEKTSRRLQAEQRFKHCVAARQQAAILSHKVRVFKLTPGWSRVYLEDEDRPQEIERLRALIEEHCDTDPDSQRQQIANALVLGRKLRIACIGPREKLGQMAESGAAPDQEKIREYQAYIDDNCPDVDYRDMWIADRIFVKRH